MKNRKPAGLLTSSHRSTKIKKRDPFFDNARFILVALVVLGHLVSPVREGSDILFFANNFLASFRMPALILITGYFTKRFHQDKGKFLKQISVNIFIPYLMFQIFYLWMEGLAGSLPEVLGNLFAPTFGMWFLLSLFTWNLLLFPFAKLKHPIFTAVLIALGIGWVDQAGEFLSISRTFVFFPLFLVGHYVRKDQLEWFKTGKAKMLGVLSLVGSLLMLSVFSLEEARNALLARHPYAEIADSALEGTWLRLVFYFIMILGIFAFLPWVPKKKLIFTPLGMRTAYIYILHLFFIKIFYQLEIFPQEAETRFLLAVPVIWLAIVFFTSSNFVVFFTKPLIEGKAAVPFLLKLPRNRKTFHSHSWSGQKNIF
ncbi:acyltransferase family protein [Planococcus salinus]|uniref:Acyltransferase n=1 Tax=Planococcus salinus TaxID=1848460 RepID=A0A3M8P817_9BACL|nr:acyltransferase family protein [Planococcus salinus]RNF39849.1 acyltransferase [Planococcus salinus]